MAEAAKVPRLTFKQEHVAKVLAQTKTATFRRKVPYGVTPGAVVAAVTSQNGKPAFLTPAADRFALLDIQSVERLWFRDYTLADALAAGFSDLLTAQEWYQRTDPTIAPLSTLFRISFTLRDPLLLEEPPE